MSMPLRVLFLEDNPSDCELTLHELHKAGFNVEWERVDNREEYLIRLDSTIDVIFADCMLPGLKVMEALEILKSRALEIPFIIVTDNSNEEVALECMKQGVCDYLLKDRLQRLVPAMQQIQKEINKRAQSEENLRESEAKYRSIIEQSHDAISIYRGDKLLFVNERACKITGYKKEELLNNTIWDLLHPEDREKVKQIGERRAKGEKVPNTYTARVLRKNGDIRQCEFAVNIIQYQGEYAALGVIRDITEKREIEKQLRQKEQLATTGQLAGGIAHDFRNFLTTIILQAQIAERAPGLPSGVEDSLEIVIGEAQQASKLVQQILDFSRQGVMETMPIDLGKFIGETAYILRQAIREDIEFTMALEPAECIVEVDLARMQQMLVNLASNARDAMPDGGKLHIKLSKMTLEKGQKPPAVGIPSGQWAHLVISDIGIGMTEEVCAHIFEPFFTTKEIDKGSGLGLAQVYGIVKQHGGFIDVQTASGKGTSFHIYLPISQSENHKIEEETDTLPKGKGERILLVEDNVQLRQAGGMILESLNYNVQTAGNGQVALKMYREQPADLVITDLVMPQMGGQELRNNLEQMGPIKVLAITGYIQQSSKAKLRRSGFIDVIEKPFNINELARIVRRSLDRD